MKLANYSEESWHLYSVQFPSKTTVGKELHLFIYLFIFLREDLWLISFFIYLFIYFSQRRFVAYQLFTFLVKVSYRCVMTDSFLKLCFPVDNVGT